MERAKIYKRRNFKNAKLLIKNNKNYIRLSFPFDKETLKNVKTLYNRKYNPSNKTWVCDFTLENYKKIRDCKFIVSEELNKLYKSQFNENTFPIITQYPGLATKLYKYQEIGASFLMSKDGKALIADEMGLGKTIQVIAWITLNLKEIPIYIICPASLKENWKFELLDKTNCINENDIEIYYPNKTASFNKPFTIINYENINKYKKEITKHPPKTVIFDECHYLKNNTTARTKAAKSINKLCKNKIFISGTPIINRPIEFFTQIKMINPSIISSKMEFGQKFCDLKYNGFGWDFNGASNLNELYDLLCSTIMIRRLKKDVLKELPEKIKIPLLFKMENEKIYFDIENDFIGFIKNSFEKEKAKNILQAETLVKLNYLKQIAIEQILNSVFIWITDFLESGGKLVIFAIHKNIIEKLMEKFGNYSVKIDGSTSINKRKLIVDKFQNDFNTRIFIGNIKAAGVGLTLTAAHNILFLELPMTPGELEQASDRCHRIGQKFSVNIHYVIPKNSIYEKIIKLLDKKTKILNKILDGGEIENQSLLTELINEYK